MTLNVDTEETQNTLYLNLNLNLNPALVTTQVTMSDLICIYTYLYIYIAEAARHSVRLFAPNYWKCGNYYEAEV